MRTLVLIKIGGGLITDKTKPFTVREDMMRVAAQGIHLAIVKNPNASFLVANGAGSFGHYLASQEAEQNTEAARVARIKGIHESVEKLNQLFTRHLLANDIPAISISPSSCISGNIGTVTSTSFEAVIAAIHDARLPSMYGDIIDDGSDKGLIISTETLFEIVLDAIDSMFDDIHVIYAGETAGVLDANKVVIPEITTSSWREIGSVIENTPGFDVTGGMRHKVESALRAAHVAKSVHIVTGKDPETIAAALSGGRVGTKIVS